MLTRALIHLDRFIQNYNTVKARLGQTRICVPVKADGYGHGALQIAKTSLEIGAFCVGVASVSEGEELRNAGISAPILLFSQPHPDEIPNLLEAKLIPFISDEEFASVINKQAEDKKMILQVHVKIDTGMSRLGCRPEEALSLAKFITSCSGLSLTGTATHLAVSDSANEQDVAFTKSQLASFKEAVDVIKKAGIDPGIVHVANSGAVILHPESWLDMIRPGILLYGYKTVNEADAPPNHKLLLSGFTPINVQPVMELRSAITMIKHIKKGETVSYGRTWTAPQDTYVAILATGYADGLPRLSSNKWQVSIDGNNYPIVGRICMDQCCVDLGPKPALNRWKEAVVFGGAAGNAGELAAVTGTIPYEITCNINKRVPRIYDGNNG